MGLTPYILRTTLFLFTVLALCPSPSTPVVLIFHLFSSHLGSKQLFTHGELEADTAAGLETVGVSISFFLCSVFLSVLISLARTHLLWRESQPTLLALAYPPDHLAQ